MTDLLFPGENPAYRDLMAVRPVMEALIALPEFPHAEFFETLLENLKLHVEIANELAEEDAKKTPPDYWTEDEKHSTLEDALARVLAFWIRDIPESVLGDVAIEMEMIAPQIEFGCNNSFAADIFEFLFTDDDNRGPAIWALCHQIRLWVEDDMSDHLREAA